MKIYEDYELVDYKKNHLAIQDNWNKRDFTKCIESYINSRFEKVLAISGLRGTGKTVGILQLLPEEDACYILCQKYENEKGTDYIEVLRNTKKKNIVIDEYTWINNRKPLDEYLMTAIQNGKRIIITGTESISLDFLKYGLLNHRVDVVHTTMFTYGEYCRLFNKELNQKTCIEFLKVGGLFPDYILDNYNSTKEYIETAIVNNLANYMKSELTETQSRTLVYSVLYDAICKSNLRKVPLLVENRITLDNFLDKMGIDKDFSDFKTYLPRVIDTLEKTGIIVRIKNLDHTSEVKEQYYLVNPCLAYQLLLAAYDIKEVPKKDMGYLFEAATMIQLYTNKLTDQEIYFYDHSEKNGENHQLDIILADKELEYAYLIECKLKQQPRLEQTNTIMTDALENTILQDTEICGRYVIYNGDPVVKNWGNKTIIFSPLGDMVDKYFQFDYYVDMLTNR